MTSSIRQMAIVTAILIGTASIATAANHTVTIQGFAFSPAELSIAAGETVTFTNADSAPHTATGAGGAFDTGRLNSGDSATLTFAGAGTFDYACAFHPSMTAKITVQ